MALGLIGKKCGMTRVFHEDGASIPVTVIEVAPNRVTQVKTVDNDGYKAVQVTKGSRKAKHVNKPKAGHFAKASVEAGDGLWEFRMEDDNTELGGEGEGALNVGGAVTVELFQAGQFVDVIGTSKGKGFAGVVKRYNFKTQDATHGNSLAHRAPGSIGQNQSPGRVFKGKKMAGQMGNKRTTVQNLEIVRVDADRNLILIKGAIPGATGGNVIIKQSVKKQTVKE